MITHDRADRPILRAAGGALLALTAVLLCSSAGTARDGDVPAARQRAQSAAYAEAFAIGQEALISDDYRAAVDAFRQAYETRPDSALAGDALYWQAFALYRCGGTSDLSAAAAYLEQLLTDYRTSGSLRDASELATRIHGELARRGDAASAALIAARAMELRRQAEEVARAEHEYQAALAERAARAAVAALPVLPAPVPDPELPDPLRIMALARTLPVPDDERDDVRLAALNALARMDQERTLPILQSVLARRDEENARLRERALMILSMQESREAEQLLLRTAREDPDPTVRGRALIHLGTTASSEVLSLLEEVLSEPGSPKLQEDALTALQFNSQPRADEILRNVAENPSVAPSIRGHAVLALSQRKKKPDLAFLQRLYVQAEDLALKEAIVMAAGLQSGDASREWLLGLIGDRQTPPSVLQRAIFRVGEDRRVATRTLIDLYARLADPAPRRQAILVIGQRGDAESFEFVVRIAREEQDPELRRAAIFLLGESRDPRALDILQEFLVR